MALVPFLKHQRPPLCAPCAPARRRQTVSRRSSAFCSNKSMSLEPVDSNEHSIRFKVLEEVQLLDVVEHILANAAAAAPPPPPAPFAGKDKEEPVAAAAIEFGRARALELLQLGAVYVGVPQKGLDFINWMRSLELPVAPTAAVVPRGHYVRVHPRPKRYPACYCADWPRRVLHCDSDYVVVNKPAGLPCMRHESNALEELASCVGRALGMEGLEVCHRLDQWTTGVVVLSRTKEANKAFKRSLQDREAGLIKTYKGLTYSPVPLGTLEHYMYDGPFNEGAPVLGGGNLRPRGPRLLSRTAHARWRLCRLDVRECREHTGAMAWYQQHFGGRGQDAVHGTAVRQHQEQHMGGSSNRNFHLQDSEGDLRDHNHHNGNRQQTYVHEPQQQQHQRRDEEEQLIPSGSQKEVRRQLLVDSCGCAVHPVQQQSDGISNSTAHPQTTPIFGADITATDKKSNHNNTNNNSVSMPVLSATTAVAKPFPNVSGRTPPSNNQSPTTPMEAPPPRRLYESTIDLHTGRTHQIRAQLASIGRPLVGDVMYAPIAGYLVGESGVVEDPDLVSQVEQLPMLDWRVGLHAWRLSWRGMTFTVPPSSILVVRSCVMSWALFHVAT